MKKLTLLFFLFASSLGFSQAPTVDPATPPTRNPVDVISIFSGAYNNITGANYNPNWQQSGLATASSTFAPTGAGNVVLAYPNFNYQGIEFNSVVDISAMEFLHLDIWTVGVAPSVAVISSGTEIPHPIPSVVGSWQSIDIPVTGITGNLTSAIQLKFAGGNGTTNGIYVDNIYFWKTAAAPGKDATLSALSVDGTPITGFTPNSASYNVVLPGGTTAVPQITLATTADPAATAVITQATAIPGNATVAVTSQDGTTNKTYTIRYFIGFPHVDAPTPPTRNPVDVISVFSDAYNNITGANYNPDWQQSGFVTASSTFQPANSGDIVLAYPNFSYQGIEFNSTLDISAMEFLHLDIWTVDGVAPDITVISSGTEIPHAIQNGDGNWQSIDIPVPGITGDLTSAIQFKFTGGNGSSNRIYVDNLYFWKAPAATGKDATLSALEVFGTPIAGFTPNSSSYDFVLPGGSTTAPLITKANTTDPSATTIITQATTIPGNATVLVTSQDSSTTNTYTVRYYIGAPHIDAPIPPARNPLDVISIFSDSYNNISGANYNPYWQQTGYNVASSTFQPTGSGGSGNVVLAYPNFGYQGIEFNSTLDITAMEFLHLDIWTVDGVAPNLTVLSSGTEIPHPIPNGDGAWQSIDIPVPGITGDLTGAIQIKFDGGNGSSTRIYVDNLYFWKAATANGKDASLIALEVDGTPVVGFSPIDTTYSIELEGGTTVVPQITLATTSDTSASAVITQATTVPGDATVTVTSQDGTENLTYTVSFVFGANVDAPTPPARNPEDVISIFSDAYDNITGANYNPDWQQSGLTSASSTFEPTGPGGSGNVVLAYPNFNYQGIEFNDSIDITDMEFFHLDIWTTNGVAPNVYVISSGTEIPHAIANDDGKWQSIDIPVQGITIDLVNTIQIKFDGGDGSSSSIYVDNLYFWKNPTMGINEFDAETFFVYPNPTNNIWNIKGNQNIDFIEVFDIQGKQVISLNPNSETVSINASVLTNGVYFVKLTSENGTKSFKLIKN